MRSIDGTGLGAEVSNPVGRRMSEVVGSMAGRGIERFSPGSRDSGEISRSSAGARIEATESLANTVTERYVSTHENTGERPGASTGRRSERRGSMPHLSEHLNPRSGKSKPSTYANHLWT